VRLYIESWRWAGVPWYLRAGKELPRSAAEVLVQLKPPPQPLFEDSQQPGRANYVRLKLQPVSAVALAARVKLPGKGFLGEQRELYLCKDAAGDGQPYERLLGDALAGDGSLFTDEDAVEAAWAVVDRVLTDHAACLPYAPGTWGPAAADALISADGGWHNPTAEHPSTSCAP
jgi:glucose-6-phosphate 1-dehydrogenase